MRWVKVFAVKIDPFSIYSWISGQKHVAELYHLPAVRDHIQLNGEDFILESYLDELNHTVSRDIVGNVRNVVDKLSGVINDFEKFCLNNEFKNDDLSSIYNAYEQFYVHYRYFLGVCDTPVFMEQAVSKRIYQQIKNKTSQGAEKYFRQLTAFLRDTYSLGEEKDLLQIDVRLKKPLTNLRDFHSHPLYHDLKQHHQKHSWMGMTLVLGKPLTLLYYFKRLKKEYGTAKITLRHINQRKKTYRRQWLETAYALKFDKSLMRSAQLLMWIRDRRFMGLTRGAYHQRKLFGAIAHKLNLEQDQIFYLLPAEMKSVLLKRKKLNRRLIKQRQKEYALVTHAGHTGPVMVGYQLNKVREMVLLKNIDYNTKEIRGICANPGKVKARVMIILDNDVFWKFQTGDILVANMTTPDYVPIMKKASAIITDMGGITCHAAIISRELGIPCIVGTKIATQVLKDGDLVEVGAERGVVTKLK